MAATDAPRGFHPAGKADGSPWNSMVRSVTAGDDEMYMFDALTLSSGVAIQGATTNTFLGVMVGFGWNETKGGVMGADYGVAFNPDNLNTGGMSRYYQGSTVNSAITDSEWSIFYVPARGSLFEGQQDDGTDNLPGEEQDIAVTQGNQTTGISKMEIDGDAGGGADVVLIHSVRKPGFASSDANAHWIFQFKYDTVV